MHDLLCITSDTTSWGRQSDRAKFTVPLSFAFKYCRQQPFRLFSNRSVCQLAQRVSVWMTVWDACRPLRSRCWSVLRQRAPIECIWLLPTKTSWNRQKIDLACPYQRGADLQLNLWALRFAFIGDQTKTAEGRIVDKLRWKQRQDRLQCSLLLLGPSLHGNGRRSGGRHVLCGIFNQGWSIWPNEIIITSSAPIFPLVLSVFLLFLDPSVICELVCSFVNEFSQRAKFRTVAFFLDRKY